MPKKQTFNKKRAIRGRGAYYPGGMTLRGKGSFFGDVGNFFKSAAGPVLGALGGVADSFLPGSGMVADGIRKLIGAGAYTPVHSNAILAQPVPKVGSSQDVGISYSHQEYLGDVTGSQDWELTQFHVNPGLPEVFPWLSGVASNFQKYRIDGLVFYLRSTSSVAISNTTDLGLGTVMGGFQTNVYDKAPGSKLEFLSLSGARSGKPSEDHIFPMECDRSKNVFGNLLVRTTGAQDDLAKYDHAVFNLATVGFPGAYYLGELWVSYKLTLMAPKVESASNVFATRTFPTHEERLHAASNRDGYWLAVPPLDDSDAVWNSTGWHTGVGTTGRPCMLVPPGSSGFYYVSFRTAAGVSVFDPDFSVLDESGTLEIDQTIIFGNKVISGTNVVRTMVVHLSCLPDRPMKLSLQAAVGTSTAPVFSISVIRLPDRMYATQATAATVSLAEKVQRIHRSTGAMSTAAIRRQAIAAEEKENSLLNTALVTESSLNPSAVSTLISPLPIRASNPQMDGTQSATSVRYR